MSAAADLRLVDRLRAVRQAVSAAIGETVGQADTGDPAGIQDPGGRDGLALVARRCRLSPFEIDVLVLVAGCELDGSLAALCGRANGDIAHQYATFGLALRTLDNPHWDAMGPDGPLRSLALLEFDRRSGGLTLARLRINERVLLALLGLDTVDEHLAEVAAVSDPAGTALPRRQAAALTDAATRWSAHDGDPLVVRGSSQTDRDSFVRVLAGVVGGRRIWTISAAMLPVDAGEQAELVRRLARESVLTGSPIVLDLDVVDPGQLVGARRFAYRLTAKARRVVLVSPEPVGGFPTASVTVDLPEPSLAENLDLWRAALGPTAGLLNGQVEQLAGQFRLPADQLRAVAAEIGPDSSSPAVVARQLWAACRTRARADLDGLADRVVPRARWVDLVLPPREVAALHDLLRHARHRSTVHERWEVGGSRRGAGVTALFSGPSGTGKSLAAEVIAADLDVDLYRVDLSQVISKYIGETEKNLRRVFEAAEHGGAVLVIDEADALFGRRTEVRDSHDRYANVEVSYLLQRMESYRGLAVLTTNLRANIDDAFVRRLAFIITFPFPDAVHRKALWERVFDHRVPVDGIDNGRLAQLNLAGGSIRNVAVHAAFLAAERGTPVTMSDLLHGARSEYGKLDRPLTPTELAGWAS